MATSAKCWTAVRGTPFTVVVCCTITAAVLFWQYLQIGRDDQHYAPAVVLQTVSSTHWEGSQYRGCHGSSFWRQVDNSAKTSGRRLSLVCWVMTSRRGLTDRADFVWRSWAARCDATFFVVTGRRDAAETLPDGRRLLVVGVGGDGADSRRHLSRKSTAAWRYALQTFPEHDWFYRADDDTYCQVDVLRDYLTTWRPDRPAYLGYVMCEPRYGTVFNAGGPGYVLSRAALQLLVSHWTVNGTRCKADGDLDDYKDGVCLSEVGVLPADTRRGTAERFIPEDLGELLAGKLRDKPHKYWSIHGPHFFSGQSDCCADPAHLVALHNVRGDRQLLVDHFLKTR